MLVTTLAVSACGDTIKPSTWAASVCQALTPWRAEITSLNRKAETEMAAAHTPADTRTNILALLDGAGHATERARAAVAKAGVPDVDGGAVIAHRFVAALAAVRDAYTTAASAVAKLPLGDADAFYAGVGDAMTKLNADYAKSGVDTTSLASKELQDDFGSEPACR
jgi:hypothetical protein